MHTHTNAHAPQLPHRHHQPVLGRPLPRHKHTHARKHKNTQKQKHTPRSDPIGITSLYIGWGRDGATWVASEMKCLKDECVR